MLRDLASQGQPEARNVFGGPLAACSMDPVTGFFRDGHCHTCSQDHGSHTVCAVMTSEFLAFTKIAGNDLSTPVPLYDFPGLKPGDRWCLCAGRWLEACQAGHAPKVMLEATNEAALEVVPLDLLVQHAAKA
jgi:uncharacterized protein (DUF2237 family)